LPTDERPLRVAEFDELFAVHLKQVEQVGPRQARMVLVGPVGFADRVRDLADRETACCSFFEFTVSMERSGDAELEAVRLQIGVPSTQTEVLAALTGRAISAMGEHS
jgi:hypothetical protein